MVAGAILLSLAYVGWQVGDNLVVSVALASHRRALLGFFLWNWPRGMIFSRRRRPPTSFGFTSIATLSLLARRGTQGRVPVL